MKPAFPKLGLLCCVSLLCLLGSATSARADAVTFTPNSGTAGDGQTFSFTLSLTTTHPFFGFSFYLDASAANSFSITGETAASASPIKDPNFVGSFPVLLSVSGNSPDFGYTSTGTTDIAAGTYTIGTVSVAVGPSVPRGTFTLTTTTGISGSEYNDAEGNVYDLPQATYTIAVPEPAAVAPLLCLMGAVLYRPRRRPVATSW